jgi:aspartyl-tRNA(Asn)/glutamyl-tRNA(Gln) amidotransferase subunit B
MTLEELKAKYDLTVGLEVHAELKTRSKMWCGCPNDPFASEPNQNVCPVCMGHPGTLPVANKEAIRSVIRVGTAAGGTIADFTEFDRKNYFYPDIPKGYQISQYKFPLVSGGSIASVELTRIHLEEDTATSTHDKGSTSLIDYNRAGVPLMELVTEPVIHTAEDAGRFARELQLLLRTLGAGDANMEKGEMRVEANISIAPKGATELGTKVEVKNLNSFRSVERAIAFEFERHAKALEKGETIHQETRGWDEDKQKTFLQRKKESSHDYRYFPDPDLPKMKLSEIDEFSHSVIKESLPELPWAKRLRYAEDYGLGYEQTEMFVTDFDLGGLFERVIAALPAVDAPDRVKMVTLVANYMTSDLVALRRDPAYARDPEPAELVELVSMIVANEVSSRGAKDILACLVREAGSPRAIAEAEGLIQKNDASAIDAVASEVVAANPKVVEEYRAGKESSLQFLIGQGMKASKGSANPGLLREALIKAISA